MAGGGLALPPGPPTHLLPRQAVAGTCIFFMAFLGMPRLTRKPKLRPTPDRCCARASRSQVLRTMVDRSWSSVRKLCTLEPFLSLRAASSTSASALKLRTASADVICGFGTLVRLT